MEAGFSIELLSETGPAYCKGGPKPVIIKVDESRGWEQYIPHETFRCQSRGFMADDIVRFKVTLRLTAKIVAHRSANVEKVVRKAVPSCLSEDFLALLKSGRGSDIALHAGQGEGSVNAHRAILMARSKVFCAMLEEGKFREGSAKVVHLIDMDIVTLRVLVLFL